MPLRAAGGRARQPSSWGLPLSFTALAGFSAEFPEKDAPTGEFQAMVEEKKSQRSARRAFKMEAYRVPTFEVQLASPTRAAGRPFKVKAVARYYAGGNVAGSRLPGR